MKLNIKVWVEEMEAQGNGIPFSPRKMYIVKDGIGSDNDVNPTTVGRYAYPAYWSLKVANRIAEERCSVLSQCIRHDLEEIKKRW